jgi:uncharacterized protein YdhG (YjbR/CyaY superfamily)
MGRSKEVDTWIEHYDNPMKEVVQKIRAIILAVDPRIDECIKWQAPTFTYRGNLASFYPKSKAHASLMFHMGAKIPGRHPRLEGSGGTSRVMRIASVADANAAKGDLKRIIETWCAWRDASAGGAKTSRDAEKTGATRAAARKVAPAATKPRPTKRHPGRGSKR